MSVSLMKSTIKYEPLNPAPRKREEMDDLFDEIDRNLTEKPYDYAEQVMEKIENDYRQPGIEVNEREKEKAELKLKLGELKRKLHQSKNIKNVRKTEINKALADKRKQIKAEMEILKDRLYQIDIEEKGADVSSQKLVDSTVKL